MSGEEASAGDKPSLAGKYVLVRNENFDEFLAANGMTLHLLLLVIGHLNVWLMHTVAELLPSLSRFSQD